MTYEYIFYLKQTSNYISLINFLDVKDWKISCDIHGNDWISLLSLAIRGSEVLNHSKKLNNGRENIATQRENLTQQVHKSLFAATEKTFTICCFNDESWWWRCAFQQNEYLYVYGNLKHNIVNLSTKCSNQMDFSLMPREVSLYVVGTIDTIRWSCLLSLLSARFT